MRPVWRVVAMVPLPPLLSQRAVRCYPMMCARHWKPNDANCRREWPLRLPLPPPPPLRFQLGVVPR